jgi:hypothetical protein
MEGGDPFRLIEMLARHQVPFVIIGGHAVNYHGYLRATEDTDVVFRRTPEVETTLYAVLGQLNACWIGSEVDPETGIERTFPVSLEYIRTTPLMMLVTDGGFLDVFDFIPGHPDESVERLFESAVESDGLKFVSLEWLRRMKQTAFRVKDQLDLENLPPA